MRQIKLMRIAVKCLVLIILMQYLCLNSFADETYITDERCMNIYFIEEIDLDIVEADLAADITEINKENPFDEIDISKFENPYKDVSGNEWFYDILAYVSMAGILDGVELFSEDAVVANAATKNLYPNTAEGRGNTVHEFSNAHKSIGGKIGSYSNNPFTDVSRGKAYYQPVLWASYNSVVNGYGDGRFGPGDGITREQMCAIIVRYAEKAGLEIKSVTAGSKFKDSQNISSWAADAVSTCQKAGIVNGYTDGTFMPKKSISRIEVLTMIYNFINNVL